MTYQDLLILALKKLTHKKQLNNYQNNLKLLLAYYANLSLAQLYAYMYNIVNFSINKFLLAVEKYNDGYPIQYLTNSQYFYNNNFYVDESVLIPRVETEELVDNLITIINNQKIIKLSNQLLIFDVGTGSGNIGLTLAKYYPQAKVYASDISLSALKIAKKNQKILKCLNITFLSGDMLSPFIKNNLKANVLVSNPPYISKNEKINDTVKKFEPHQALFADDDGLFYYKNIFKNYQKIMLKPGILCFEYGYQQQKKLEILVQSYFPDCSYQFLKDISNNWRMLFIFIN